MTRVTKVILTSVVAIAAATNVFAATDDILGPKCGNDYCGKILWLKEPVYPQGLKEGTPGTPKIDYKNPDVAHQKAPLMGLQIVNGLQFSSDNAWKNGKIYDADSRKTYSAKATLVSHDHLDLRGFIGVSLIGRTEKWTRAK